MNPQIRETLEWLKQQGLPPLPIAPAQDPERFPARNQDGSLKIGQDGVPLPAFTGKNPSFLDLRGIPHLIRHTRYQDRLPSDHELNTWFSNPANGIGTLGGWRGLVWIDVDVKQFESQAACDSRIAQWLNHYPLLRQTFTERTHSGGWRFAVRVHEKTFTNFSLDGAGGMHMGEALGQGRFTVLAPTIGPSGNAYVNLNRAPPVWVERLDTIGLYPVSRRREQAASSYTRPQSHPRPPQPGVLRIEDLTTAKAQSILHGESPLESRSHSLTYALREFYGWENWAARNGVPISGDAEDLARQAGEALEIDRDRTERIIQSLPDPANCVPTVVFAGGEISAWKRIWKLSRCTYNTCCPLEIQKVVRDELKSNFSEIRRFAHLDRTQGQNKIQGDNQILHFIQNAKNILYASKHSKSINDSGRPAASIKYLQGQVYRIELEGNRLTIYAKNRGKIFEVENSNVEVEELTKQDIRRFSAELLRLKQKLIYFQEGKPECHHTIGHEMT